MSNTFKKLKPTQWESLKRNHNKKDKMFLRVPWDILKSNSDLISDYIDGSISTFAELKAFIVLQSEFLHRKDEDERDEHDYETYEINRFKLFRLPQVVRETKLTVTIQNAYSQAVREGGFLKLPYKKYDKCRGKDGTLVEAVLFTYMVEDFETLWKMVASKYGAEEFRKGNLKSYCKKHHSELFKAPSRPSKVEGDTMPYDEDLDHEQQMRAFEGGGEEPDTKEYREQVKADEQYKEDMEKDFPTVTKTQGGKGDWELTPQNLKRMSKSGAFRCPCL